MRPQRGTEEYRYIVLSPRGDLSLSFSIRGPTGPTITTFKNALKVAGVEVSSMLPPFRWSGQDGEARQAAGRYWKQATYILGWATMSDG